jgi:hypothetical protein
MINAFRVCVEEVLKLAIFFGDGGGGIDCSSSYNNTIISF